MRTQKKNLVIICHLTQKNKMLKVKVKDGNVERALKKFKRKFRDTKVLDELRRRAQYDKPSKVKREKKVKASYTNKVKKELGEDF